jgi:hypothetical protein
MVAHIADTSEPRVGVRRAAVGALGGPGPRHELVQARGRPQVHQLREHVGQIGLRLDPTELASLDERGNAGPVLRALIKAELILPGF